MMRRDNPKVRMWLAEPLPPDVAASLRTLGEPEDVHWMAVMPDVHLASEVCVGVALASRELIFPNAVGGDIGCGIAAMAFDCEAAALRDRVPAARLLADLYRSVPANRQRKPQELPETLARHALNDGRLEQLKSRDGRVQFGTLGRGNHFLEFQADEDGRLWLMVHSGSRAIGQAIRDHHLARATRAGALHALPAASAEGQAYLADMAWASAYAAGNRRSMATAAAAAVESVLNGRPLGSTYIDCVHNFLRPEMHFGRQLWVHRKGAISAGAGESGIIPGSMGSASYHVEGRGMPESLCSSSHGAGRTMSRSDARRRISARELHRQMGSVWFDHRAADRLRDEAPGAYKDIEAVMRAQRDLTRIVRILRPVLAYKGA